MPQLDATEVWDRAIEYLADGLPEDAGYGDRHLTEALSVDGAIEANGMEQVFETHDMAEAIIAFRWFGLEDVAEYLEEAPSRIGTNLDEDEEEDASNEYYELDVVDRLTEALEEKLETNPDAFLPL